MKKNIVQSLLVAFALLLCSQAEAAFVRNMPVARLQPNGDTLRCFVTGDEYYQRLHDAQGYTIVMDADGWYVYATLLRGEPSPPNYIAGHTDPAAVGLKPGIGPAKATLKKLRRALDVPENYRQARRKTTSTNHGTLNNIVIFIRLADDDEITTPLSSINAMFNDSAAGAVSMYNYFKTVSYNQLYVPSHLYPTSTSDTVRSYQDSHTRSYYMPYSSSNTQGYHTSEERASREFGLLQRAVEWVNAHSPVPTSINLDYDNDGYIDNMVFVIKGTYTGWGDLLWPHKWQLYDRDVRINGRRVGTFTIQLEGSGSHYFSVSTFCHEMFHTLGAPDLYNYNDYTDVHPVGSWDLMENNLTPPQHMGAYMKWRYGRWINAIPILQQPGTYSLHSLGHSTHNCYRIPTEDRSQWYILEYRHTSDAFESALPGSGLLIYRADLSQSSNQNFDGEDNFDELWLFRPDSFDDTTNGSYARAFFSQQSGRTEFSPSTNPRPMLTAYTPDSSISITQIGPSGADSIVFTYNQLRPTTACPVEDQCSLMVVTRQPQNSDWGDAFISFSNDEGHCYAVVSHDGSRMLDTHYVGVCPGVVHVHWSPSMSETPTSCYYEIYDASGRLRLSGSGSAYDNSIGSFGGPCGYSQETATITVLTNDGLHCHVYGGGSFSTGTIANVRAHLDDHYHLAYWMDSSATATHSQRLYNEETTRSIIVERDTILTAVAYMDSVSIDITLSDSTLGTVRGGGEYPYGSLITLRASAYSPHRFLRWEYDETTSTTNPLRLPATRNYEVHAVFEAQTEGIGDAIQSLFSATPVENGIVVNNPQLMPFEIVNMQGQVVHHTDAAQNNTERIALPIGIYIVHSTDKTPYAIKVVVR